MLVHWVLGRWEIPHPKSFPSALGHFRPPWLRCRRTRAMGLGAVALARARFVLRKNMSRDPSRELSADRKFVLAAVRYSPPEDGASYLKHASTELRADREVVLAAVKKRGSALQYASAGLRADREVVMTALLTGPGRKYRDNFFLRL